MFIEGILTSLCLGSCATDNRINNGLLAGFSVSQSTSVFLGSWENSEHHDSVVAGATVRAFASDWVNAGIVVGYGGFRRNGPSHVRSVPITSTYADVKLYGPGFGGLYGRFTVAPEIHAAPQAIFSIRWEQ